MSKFIQTLKNIFAPEPAVEVIAEHVPEPEPVPAPQEPDTRPIEEQPGEKSGKAKSINPYLVAGYKQSRGRQRDHNEDALFSLTSMLSYNKSALPIGFYIVADGMGGHKHGEVASEVAIRAMVEHVLNKLYVPFLSLNPYSSNTSYQEILQEGVLSANAAILLNANGGGTTITAVLIVGEQMTIAHVGDSRVYSIQKNGDMKALTRDHSLVKRLIELGRISPQEAAVHPQRNVLYRALGQGETFEPELISTKIPSSGSLLLCSDGLWNVLSEKTISTIIMDNPTPQAACEELVEVTNQAGGPDNISTILVDLPG